MIPVDQTTFGKGTGNCWVACVASITQMTLSELKDLQREYLIYANAWYRQEDGGDDITLEERSGYVRELAKLGWAEVYLERHGVPMFPVSTAIASGPGPRGCDHSVVYFSGKLEHDPHPDRAGLLEVESYSMLWPISTPPAGPCGRED